MNKRGISAIVATVLIILITVAAVVIIWIAILPMIQKGFGFDDPNARIDVVTLDGYTSYDARGYVSVQLKRGADESDIRNVQILLNFNGSSEDHIKEAPEPNQMKIYCFNVSQYGVPETVRAAPVFVKGNSWKQGMATSKVDIPFGNFVDLSSCDEIFGMGDCDDGETRGCGISLEGCNLGTKTCVGVWWDSCEYPVGGASCYGGFFCDDSAQCVECLGEGHCDDFDGCTDDSCNGENVCVHTPNDCECSKVGDCDVEECNNVVCESNNCVYTSNDLLTYDDGLFCTDGDVCSGGDGVPGPLMGCTDGVDCTTDTCNEVLDACGHVADNTFCDDGLFCTGVETCNVLSDCQSGIPEDCDDGVDCTTDTCNEVLDACGHVADNTFCDDGLFCTGVETCNVLSGCQSGIPKDCDDGVDCTDDSCSGDSCSNNLNDANCIDDGNDCTKNKCGVSGCYYTDFEEGGTSCDEGTGTCSSGTCVPLPVCGNKVCESGENTINCPMDCPTGIAITTCEDLEAISLTGEYYLKNDVDCSNYKQTGAGFIPIGPDSSNSFTGKFDGRGYTINGLYINRPTTDRVGLFGSVYGGMAEIKNLGLINPNIVGKLYIGGLVGWGRVTLDNCFVEGGNINGVDGKRVGGLIGLAYSSIITNCYTQTTVRDPGWNPCIAGLIGYNYGTGSYISNNYAATVVVHEINYNAPNEAGLIGCADTIAGGDNFWDLDVSGQTAARYVALGKSTTQMKQQSTFTNAGWDFTNVWRIDEGSDYPRLRVFD